MDNALKLEDRAGLPEALRALLQEIPRLGWERHPDFPGLAQFWMQRHVMFRQILAALADETERHLDAAIPADRLTAQVGRLGGMLLGGLHDHHTMEDTVYFPKMQVLEPRLARGFEMLDADHHALDGWLNGFADAANALIARPTRDKTGAFHAAVTHLALLLDRHLTDEEDLVVPVILRTGLQ